VSTRARVVVTLFAAWTLFVWVTRINNVLSADEMGTAGKVLTVLLSLSLIGLAGAAVWSVWTGRAPRVIAVAAGWTIAVWVVRVPTIITLTGVTVGFKVVHTVLAIVSVVLAVILWRVTAVSREREPAGTLS
jgi:hypothetical protein